MANIDQASILRPELQRWISHSLTVWSWTSELYLLSLKSQQRIASKHQWPMAKINISQPYNTIYLVIMNVWIIPFVMRMWTSRPDSKQKQMGVRTKSEWRSTSTNNPQWLSILNDYPKRAPEASSTPKRAVVTINWTSKMNTRLWIAKVNLQHPCTIIPECLPVLSSLASEDLVLNSDQERWVVELEYK